MYNDLINTLRHCAECDHHGCAADCRFGKKYPLNFICIEYLQREAADAIEELRAKADLHKEVAEEYRRVNMMLIDKFPQWIPVSERLPKEDETVLTWGKEHQCILLDWMHDNKWCCFGGAGYWMPLPEPPKEE